MKIAKIERKINENFTRISLRCFCSIIFLVSMRFTYPHSVKKENSVFFLIFLINKRKMKEIYNRSTISTYGSESNVQHVRHMRIVLLNAKNAHEYKMDFYFYHFTSMLWTMISFFELILNGISIHVVRIPLVVGSTRTHWNVLKWEFPI